MTERRMIEETVIAPDCFGRPTPIVEVIAALTAALEKIPPEYRGEAMLKLDGEIWWSGIAYERPMTDAEIEARATAIEKQRAKASETKTKRVMDNWIRNVRMRYVMDIPEAVAFIESDADANAFHPDVYMRGTQ